ncbi:MAG: hypothetical protein ABL958_15390, partial [Bdellovibrionia bacterium]
VNDLPSGGHWSKMNDRDPPAWRLSTYLEMKFDDRDGNFFYEGKQPPTLSSDGHWQMKEESGRLYFISKSQRGKKREKRNWWDNVGGDSERGGHRKDRTYKYKYVIENTEAPSDEAPVEGAEKEANFIHIKGSTAEAFQRRDDGAAATPDNSRIIIRESKRNKKSGLIIESREPGASNFEPYDAHGKVHPFFEIAREDEPDTSSHAGDDVEIREHEGSRGGRLGPLSVVKGGRGGDEPNIERGKQEEADDILRELAKESGVERPDITAGSAEHGDVQLHKGAKEGDQPNITQSGAKGDGPNISQGGAEGEEPHFSQSEREKENLARLASTQKRRRGPKWEQLDEADKKRALERAARELSEDEPDISARPDADLDAIGLAQGEDEPDISEARGVPVPGEDDAGTAKAAADSDPAAAALAEAEKEKEERRKRFGRKLHSILAESSIRALEEMSSDAPEVNEIKNTRRLGVIPVQTINSKGVLLVAMGDNKEVGEVMLKEIKNHLVHHLKLRGQDMSSSDDLEILIDQVDFVDWGKVEMEFMALDQLGSDQVGVAFLSGDDIIPEVSQSAEEHMLAVDLECILPDAPITFDIYIYMPENKKYIRYVKKGQHIDPSQLDRLRSFETEYFHIKKLDIKNFKAYCAANYINVLIRGSRISKAS